MNPVHAAAPRATPQPPALLLVRHGDTDLTGAYLCGRMPAVHLNARGRAQAEALAQQLASQPIAAIYSSPLERAYQTARIVAAPHALDVVIDEGLIEVDFGAWTGLSFAALAHRSDWRRYNEARASATIPGGEPPLATQDRILSTIDTLARRHRDDTVVAVSHAEPIRYAHLFSGGRTLDAWRYVTVETASITCVRGRWT